MAAATKTSADTFKASILGSRPIEFQIRLVVPTFSATRIQRTARNQNGNNQTIGPADICNAKVIAPMPVWVEEWNRPGLTRGGAACHRKSLVFGHKARQPRLM